MFGQSDDADNGVNGQIPSMDPAVSADPGAMPAMDQTVPSEHQMTPAYSNDSPADQLAPAVDDYSGQQASSAPAVGAVDNADDDLLNIKQDALSALAPLVRHLDQTPEEKFRTTMMMIQASDDRTLVSQAYESAQAITDDRVRAQALLDVVNEINYFTSQTS